MRAEMQQRVTRTRWLELTCLAFATLFAFSAQCAVQRPVVFVPGILGTKLCNNQGVVWGGVSSYSNVSQLDTLLLPPRPLHTCGLIDRVDILGPFFAIHQYDSLLATFKALGALTHQNCYR